VPSATLVLHYLCYDDSRQISITKEKRAFLRFPRSCYDTNTCNRCKRKTNDTGSCSSILSDANLYKFLWIFSDEWVVMQPCTLRAHHASITRNHVRIQSYTLFPRVKSMTNLEHLVPSARHRCLLAGLGSRSVRNCWFSNKYWWTSIAFSFSTWFPVQSIIKLDWVIEGDVTP